MKSGAPSFAFLRRVGCAAVYREICSSHPCRRGAARVGHPVFGLFIRSEAESLLCASPSLGWGLKLRVPETNPETIYPQTSDPLIAATNLQSNQVDPRLPASLEKRCKGPFSIPPWG